MHVYIHVPFCARRCSYCDFAIAVRRDIPNGEFASAIRREWTTRELGALHANDVETLYFGGGTPSRLDPEVIAELVAVVDAERGLATQAEVTLETNPDDVTLAAARAWRAAGVNRISLGVQSHHPNVLEWMHRVHTADQVPIAVAMLCEAGFANISMDLIFALPQSLARDWRADLAATLALEPTHVSLYGLTVEPHTALAKWTARGDAVPPLDDRYAAEFLLANVMLRDAGFEHYEVSNAARPGFRSRHNSAYWQRVPYAGLGPSAHSLEGRSRSWNAREWADYHRRIMAGEPVTAGEELLDDQAVALEERYLGLRTTTGIALDRVTPKDRAHWCESGWATRDLDRLALTPEGWLRLDALVGGMGDS